MTDQERLAIRDLVRSNILFFETRGKAIDTDSIIQAVKEDIMEIYKESIEYGYSSNPPQVSDELIRSVYFELRAEPQS